LLLRVLKTSKGDTVTLASFEGKPLVLFFYPKAATPGCTKEVCRPCYATAAAAAKHLSKATSSSKTHHSCEVVALPSQCTAQQCIRQDDRLVLSPSRMVLPLRCEINSKNYRLPLKVLHCVACGHARWCCMWLLDGVAVS